MKKNIIEKGDFISEVTSCFSRDELSIKSMYPPNNNILIKENVN